MAAIPDAEGRALARRNIAQVQAIVGDAAGIRSLASTVMAEDLYDRMEMESLVAVAELRQGNLPAAMEALGSIDAGRLLSDPAGAYARQPYEAALTLLSRARAADGDVAGAVTAARRQDNEGTRDRMLGGVVMAQADAGDAQGARGTAGLIDDMSIRDGALTYVVFRQAAEGDFIDARLTAQSISANRGPINETTDLWPPLIDGSLVVSSELDSESVSFPELWECLNGFLVLVPTGDMDSRSRAVLGVALAQHDAGEVSAARLTVGSLDAGRDSAFAALAVMSVRAGDYEGARRSSAPMRRGRNSVLTFIATAEAAAGDVGGARGSPGGGLEDLLGSLLESTGDDDQGVILEATADAFAGDIDAAKDATMFLGDRQVKDRFLWDVANWQAFNGNAEGALETLLGVQDVGYLHYYGVVQGLAQGGYAREAVETASRLFPEPMDRVLTLVGLAGAAAAAEQVRAGEWFVI